MTFKKKKVKIKPSKKIAMVKFWKTLSMLVM